MKVTVTSLALGGLAAWCAPAAAPIFPPLAKRFRIQTRLENTSGIALTFDDGPHPEGTPAVLEVLERAGAKATFFLVGEQAERYPSIVDEIAAAGHEVAMHGYRHMLQLRRAPGELREDFRCAADALAALTGYAPRYFRPPYGVFSSVGLSIARSSGYTPLLWSRWGKDWTAHATPAAIASRVAANLTAGDIVLLHDSDAYSSPASWRRTVSALPWVVEAAAEIDAPLVSLSEST